MSLSPLTGSENMEDHSGYHNAERTQINTNETATALNTTHRTSDGSDHTFLDQSVISGATPTFTNTNFTEATDKNYVTDAEQTVIGNTSNTNSGDQDISGKQAIPTRSTIASDATPNPTGDAEVNIYTITALAAAAEFAAPSGTPVDGNTLRIRILDDGTGRALTYNAIYRAIGVTLPTTTTASKTIHIGAIYNSADTKWDAVAVSEEA